MGGQNTHCGEQLKIAEKKGIEICMHRDKIVTCINLRVSRASDFFSNAISYIMMPRYITVSNLLPSNHVWLPYTQKAGFTYSLPLNCILICKFCMFIKMLKMYECYYFDVHCLV